MELVWPSYAYILTDSIEHREIPARDSKTHVDKSIRYNREYFSGIVGISFQILVKGDTIEAISKIFAFHNIEKFIEWVDFAGGSKFLINYKDSQGFFEEQDQGRSDLKFVRFSERQTDIGRIVRNNIVGVNEKGYYELEIQLEYRVGDNLDALPYGIPALEEERDPNDWTFNVQVGDVVADDGEASGAALENRFYVTLGDINNLISPISISPILSCSGPGMAPPGNLVNPAGVDQILVYIDRPEDLQGGGAPTGWILEATTAIGVQPTVTRTSPYNEGNRDINFGWVRIGSGSDPFGGQSKILGRTEFRSILYNTDVVFRAALINSGDQSNYSYTICRYPITPAVPRPTGNETLPRNLRVLRTGLCYNLSWDIPGPNIFGIKPGGFRIQARTRGSSLWQNVARVGITTLFSVGSRATGSGLISAALSLLKICPSEGDWCFRIRSLTSGWSAEVCAPNPRPVPKPTDPIIIPPVSGQPITPTNIKPQVRYITVGMGVQERRLSNRVAIPETIGTRTPDPNKTAYYNELLGKSSNWHLGISQNGIPGTELDDIDFVTGYERYNLGRARSQIINNRLYFYNITMSDLESKDGGKDHIQNVDSVLLYTGSSSSSYVAATRYGRGVYLDRMWLPTAKWRTEGNRGDPNYAVFGDGQLPGRLEFWVVIDTPGTDATSIALFNSRHDHFDSNIFLSAARFHLLGSQSTWKVIINYRSPTSPTVQRSISRDITWSFGSGKLDADSSAVSVQPLLLQGAVITSVVASNGFDSIGSSSQDGKPLDFGTVDASSPDVVLLPKGFFKFRTNYTIQQ